MASAALCSQLKRGKSATEALYQEPENQVTFALDKESSITSKQNGISASTSRVFDAKRGPEVQLLRRRRRCADGNSIASTLINNARFVNKITHNRVQRRSV